METKTETENRGKGHDPQLVEVELNGHPKQILAGEYTGLTLKSALGVPLEHELELVRNGKFHPVGNDEKIKIKGEEKFVSHAGQGQSS
jgi:hypothetical protein